LIALGREQVEDILVQGCVSIASGVVILAALFMPWLSSEYTAIAGLIHAKNQTAYLAVPLTLILISILMIFGGAIHILGYKIGIQLATVTSAVAFFISVMVVVVTLASLNDFDGTALDLLIGPWIGVIGSIFGTLSSKLKR
jgi:hypothetical protein